MIRRTVVLSLVCLLGAGCAGVPETPVAAEPARIARPLPPGMAIPGEATGSLSGAPFRIEVPDNWNGELVLFLHGYEPRGTPRDLPLVADDFDRWVVGEGYAIARSAYSAQGWAVGEAIEENEALRKHALTQLGGVNRTWLIGNSMGGHITLATLERHGQAYAGGLSLCGLNSPAEEMIAAGALAPLAALELLFPDALPLGPEGLADPQAPAVADIDRIEAELRRNEARAAQLSRSVEARRGDLAAALQIRYVVLRELIERAGGLPVGNADYRYIGFGNDGEFNAVVRRYTANQQAAAYLRERAELSGRPLAPVLIQSNAYDPNVPRRVGERYAELAQVAGTAERVRTLAPFGDGHCAFEPQDIARAFEELTRFAAAR